MKKILGGLMLIILLLTMNGCDPANQYEKEIASIDSCMAVLDSIETKMQGIEFDSLVMMVAHVERNESEYKEFYVDDTLDSDFGLHMTYCKGIRKTMKGAKGKQKEFQDEIAALRVQLTTLKEDILNGVLKKDQINEYLHNERDDLEKLNLVFTSFYDSHIVEKGIYYTSVPVIDARIEKMKAQRLVIEE